MDGLLIAEQLGRLEGRLPAARGAWRFPDDRTAVLPLADGTSLWLVANAQDPSLEVRLGAQVPQDRTPRTPFQAQVAARATGDLVAARQLALDRVIRLAFGEGTGFVPERPIDLVVELTGRNANLILVDADDRIVGAQRSVGPELNRHRQIRAGAPYVPPPPYTKLDPRTLTDEGLRTNLAGKTLRDVRKTVDGIGPQLYAALANRLAPLDEGTPLSDADLTRTVAAVRELVAEPAAALRAAGAVRPGAAAVLADLAARRETLRKRLTKLVSVADKRMADARQALVAAQDASAERAEADLLLARAADFAPHGDTALLLGFDSLPVRLTIDPALDAAGNAARRYDHARRKEARAERAAQRFPELEANLSRLKELMRSLPGADAETLDALEASLNAERGAEVAQVARAAGKTGGGRKAKQPLPGVLFVDPRGFEVLVGRSAKENDAITFGVAKSRDLWLHVQGYQGAHVLVRAHNRELPFDTVLFAARLAAGFSRAKDSDNVAVDYTERKNVWRVKGAPPGAVHIAHQKTVYVTPARNDAQAGGSQGE